MATESTSTSTRAQRAHELRFRLLNDLERQSITIAAKRGRVPADGDLVMFISSFIVSYENQKGGFCVCNIYLDDARCIWRGASRRSYRDRRNPIKGQMLAFHRAIQYSRPHHLP